MSLSREYNNFPLLDFLPCAPSGVVPEFLYNFLRGNPPPNIYGRAEIAPYALRKLEAALLAQHPSEEVVIVHEDYLEAFIKPDTEIIGVYTMDPLGLGPLTMSYSVLFDNYTKPWVRIQFERLMHRINAARKNTHATLIVGGPGVWELTMMPGAMEELGIDLAFQGEADDIINELFDDIASEEVYNGDYFHGYQSFDNQFHKTWVSYDRFLTRKRGSKQVPSIDEIPLIRGATVKGLLEVMRGCGVGCDFCEVTLRPLRYYSPESVAKEVAVEKAAGYTSIWLHSDEIFAYQHGPHFTPNADAIKELFQAVISVKGITYTNPTHGRISIPAAYPELVKMISSILGAGPEKWIGVQVGLETGSDRLAMIHMPNKTLPMKIGADGSWQEIVKQGLAGMNRAYWRPAFTVQVGQPAETPEDNWETIAMVNRLSEMDVDGRPSEFTVTPMQNMPLGLIRSKQFSSHLLDKSQLAVYYACYRHLLKMTIRDGLRDSHGNFLVRAMMGSAINLGSWGLLLYIERLCKRRGVDLEKVKHFGLAA